MSDLYERPSNLAQYVLLVVFASGGGALIGMQYPVLAVRGAILFGGLALTVPIINRLSYRTLDEARPTTGTALRVGVAMGLAIGVLLGLIPWLNQPVGGGGEIQIVAVTPAGWPTIVACVVYAVALQGGYALRWCWPRFWTPVLVIALALATAVRVIVTPEIGELFFFYAPIQGIPLGLFWLALLAALDPAFSAYRWRMRGRCSACEE